MKLACEGPYYQIILKVKKDEQILLVLNVPIEVSERYLVIGIDERCFLYLLGEEF